MRAILAAAVLAGCSGSGPDGSSNEPRTEWTAADIAKNNRGVALMGYFDYAGARATFAELVDERPGLHDARINLAIATLNRQEEGDERRALAIVDAVLAEDPGHLRAQYVKGLLLLNGGSPDEARTYFEAVARARPDDAYAAYFTAQTLAKSGRLEEAVTAYRRAIDADPYLRSAYYGAAQTLRRLGQTDEARALLTDYQRFEDNPRARLAEFKYTRMGPLANATTVDDGAEVPPEPPTGPVFGDAVRLADAVADDATSLTVVDVDGDDDPDLFVSGLGGNTLLLAGGDGRFTLAHDHPLTTVAGVRAAAWGDIDNDGDTDVYLCRNGPNALWLAESDGRWRAAGDEAGVAGEALDSVDCVTVDADHDGDLDLIVANADGPDELFSNNLDGTFRPLAKEQGLDGGNQPSHGIVTADLDSDRDADIVVLHADGTTVRLNDRLWSYRAAGDPYAAVTTAALLGAVAADVDADGQAELYGIERAGAVVRFAPDENGTWRRTVVGPGLDTANGQADIAVQDFDGDGVGDLVLRDAEGLSVVRLSDGVRLLDDATRYRVATPFVDGATQGPSIVAISAQAAAVMRIPPSSGRWPFLAVTVTGKEDNAESMRSNRSGIGTRLSLRAGSRWAVATSFDNDSAPGSSLQPLTIGLGPADRADYVAIDWSDGVFQTELDLAPGGLHRIAETQRQLSSCPVLFAWNGERFAFVSDLLGVGGIGFFVRPGQYAEPRPWERFLFPDGALLPRDGRYEIRVTEPMEEIAYLDAAYLEVYDLPAGWAVVPDDRMATGAPLPTGEPLFYRREVRPSRAFNDRGKTVTDAIVDADARAAPPGAPDRRFLGRLAREHVLTLEFDEPLRGAGATLVADGWVEYPYSQTVFAAWQAGAGYEPPTLEIRAGGRWQTLYEAFGYPAGMPRRMALPLGALPDGVDALRLRTTLQVYWDAIRIVFAETPPPHDVYRLAPVTAVQTEPGFMLRTDGPQRRPHYDYGARRPLWDTRYLSGWYSGPGDVAALVTEVDSAVAVIGPGEEIQLAYAAPPPPPIGTVRRLVLDVRGWAKDMDLYTRDGGTVAPMPLRSPDDRAARDALHEQYLTRYRAGH